jgi:hypothetical protein
VRYEEVFWRVEPPVSACLAACLPACWPAGRASRVEAARCSCGWLAGGWRCAACAHCKIRPTPLTHQCACLPACSPACSCITEWQTLEPGESRFIAETTDPYWEFGAVVADPASGVLLYDVARQSQGFFQAGNDTLGCPEEDVYGRRYTCEWWAPVSAVGRAGGQRPCAGAAGQPACLPGRASPAHHV